MLEAERAIENYEWEELESFFSGACRQPSDGFETKFTSRNENRKWNLVERKLNKLITQTSVVFFFVNFFKFSDIFQRS